MKDSVKRSLWRIGLLLLPILFVGLFSSCSDDDDEPNTGSSNGGLVGTWMTHEYNFGYRFNRDGTFICYDDDGSRDTGTYRVFSDEGDDILILDWDDDEREYVPYSLTGDRLTLFSDKGLDVIYKQSDDYFDEDEEGSGSGNREYHSSLFGEWIEEDGGYVYDYYSFYSDGTGIHGSYEWDIDWVNEDEDIEWYTVDKEYLYIDGTRYRYWCDGSTLEIEIKGEIRTYYEK